MRIQALLPVLFLMILLVPLPASGRVETLYTDEVDGYHYLNGEILRTDSDREFTIDDYVFFDQAVNDQSRPFVNITMTTSGTFGGLETVTQQMGITNFSPTIEYLDNGSLHEVSWDIALFRIPEPTGADPFGDNGSVFSSNQLDHRRFDQKSLTNEFAVALEYFEYHWIDGELVKLRVNTELTTDNHDDGRIIRTAIHIVKRVPEGDILFEWGRDIKEVNDAYKFFNVFDQPFLWVPFQFAVVIGLVYSYMRIMRYVQENNLKIVKGADEDESPPESTEPNTEE